MRQTTMTTPDYVFLTVIVLAFLSTAYGSYKLGRKD